MEERNGKFTYSYAAPTEEERREITDIRRAYASEEKKESKLERLRALDRKVKNLPMAFSLSLGILGALIFGLGMAVVLEWSDFVWLGWGILLGLVGLALVACAYPAYKFLLERNKKKYGEEIIALSDELLNRSDER